MPSTLEIVFYLLLCVFFRHSYCSLFTFVDFSMCLSLFFLQVCLIISITIYPRILYFYLVTFVLVCCSQRRENMLRCNLLFGLLKDVNIAFFHCWYLDSFKPCFQRYLFWFVIFNVEKQFHNVILVDLLGHSGLSEDVNIAIHIVSFIVFNALILLQNPFFININFFQNYIYSSGDHMWFFCN